ncbi:MAG: RNase adapter RapZ [Actinomycetota bacterium]
MELTVITGMSGAGKSQAMGAFEDAGWFCVDNLPPRLLRALADLFTHEGATVDRAAVVCDVRGGRWFAELVRELDRLAAVDGVTPRVVFLEASDETLLNRFRETRRRHPLPADTLLTSIGRERELLSEVRERADVVVDTTGMNIWDLRRLVGEATMTPQGRPRMQVTFMSFGYKHGVPHDADLLFDVRFLRNPHYVPELRPYTGLDPAVAGFIAEAPGLAEFRDRVAALLDFLLPAYAEEGKRHIVVGFGCTGGRHRSVYLADLMGRRYADGPWDVSSTHRDIERAGPRPAPGDQADAAASGGAAEAGR